MLGLEEIKKETLTWLFLTHAHLTKIISFESSLKQMQYKEKLI